MVPWGSIGNDKSSELENNAEEEKMKEMNTGVKPNSVVEPMIDKGNHKVEEICEMANNVVDG